MEKKTQSARGVVEIDVYAEETVRGRKYAITCECKYWRSRIPQAVVHGFRTVVQEIEANIGYIVSMEGFRSGAAGDLTNLKLLTWQEFQDIFEESWLEAFFTHQVDKRLGGLMTYAEPLLPAWFENMTDDDKTRYLSLKEKHDLFGIVMLTLGPYSRIIRKEPIPTLPLRARLKPDSVLSRIPDYLLDKTGYREFLEASIVHGEAALAEFRVSRNKYAT